MTYLLDTNVWLFGYLEPEVLPEEIQKILDTRDVQLGLSAISVWEAAKKQQVGKLNLKQELNAWLKGALAAHIHLLPLSPEIIADVCDRSGVGSVLAIPILHDRSTIGWLAALSRSPTAFDDQQASTLELVATLLGGPVSLAQSAEAHRATLYP